MSQIPTFQSYQTKYQHTYLKKQLYLSFDLLLAIIVILALIINLVTHNAVTSLHSLVVLLLMSWLEFGIAWLIAFGILTGRFYLNRNHMNLIDLYQYLSYQQFMANNHYELNLTKHWIVNHISNIIIESNTVTIVFNHSLLTDQQIKRAFRKSYSTLDNIFYNTHLEIQTIQLVHYDPNHANGIPIATYQN